MLRYLEQRANNNPKDPNAQAEYLQVSLWEFGAGAAKSHGKLSVI